MLEAMSSAVPPVVTAVGEIPRFVRSGETGYLVPVGDVGAITDALDRLLSDDALRTAMGEAAAADVRRRTSIESVSQAYRRLFRTV
jgi:glycosyltransferase involved in cell wall biosynthesis